MEELQFFSVYVLGMVLYPISVFGFIFVMHPGWSLSPPFPGSECIAKRESQSGICCKSSGRGTVASLQWGDFVSAVTQRGAFDERYCCYVDFANFFPFPSAL